MGRSETDRVSRSPAACDTGPTPRDSSTVKATISPPSPDSSRWRARTWPRWESAASAARSAKSRPRDGGEIEPEQVGEALVVDDEPVGRVHHAQRHGHVVESGIEALVGEAHLAIAAGQHGVAALQLGVDGRHLPVGGGEVRRGGFQLPGRALEAIARRAELPVMPAEEAQQGDAEGEAGRKDGREDPVEARQLRLGGGGAGPAEAPGLGGQAREFEVERRHHLQGSLAHPRPVDAVDPGGRAGPSRRSAGAGWRPRPGPRR